MKTEVSFRCDASLSQNLKFKGLRGLLIMDRGEEKLCIMSGKTDFPAAFLSKLLLPALSGDAWILKVVDEGFPVQLKRRLELEIPTIWANVRPKMCNPGMNNDSYDAWNVEGTMQKIEGNVQFDVKVERDLNMEEMADPFRMEKEKLLATMVHALDHNETIHTRVEANKDFDQGSETSHPNLDIQEGTSIFHFVMEDETLVQGCLFTTWACGSDPARNIRKEPSFVRHEARFEINGSKITMIGKSPAETRGVKRGGEGEGDDEEVNAANAALSVEAF